MASSAFKFSVQRFDCQGQDKAIAGTVTALESANLALWMFVKILRGKIFPNAPNVLSDDPESRHLISFVGDGPMGVARWKPNFFQSGIHDAIIERFGIVQSKRRQGNAKRFLRVVVEDIWTFYAQKPTHPQALIAYVPQNDSFAAMKLFQSVGFQATSQAEMVVDNTLLQMQMAWGCCNPQVNE